MGWFDDYGPGRYLNELDHYLESCPKHRNPWNDHYVAGTRKYVPHAPEPWSLPRLLQLLKDQRLSPVCKQVQRVQRVQDEEGLYVRGGEEASQPARQPR